MTLLALVTDAFGGRGGIAAHNRHLLAALASAPGVTRVVALPRLVTDDPGTLPDGLDYRTHAAGSKRTYLRALARTLGEPRPGLVVCGHLHLLPLAWALAARRRARLVLVVHGIEAWPAPGALQRALVRRVDTLVSVSRFTLGRVQAWAGLPPDRTAVVPNAIDLGAYAPGPRRPGLLARYGLAGRHVVLTLGRMAAAERYKGHDEILAVLPALAERVPDVAWLIAGDGDDRPRLEARARDLGVADRVVFAGYVSDDEKLDHLRLADVFAMPGRGEGFGIVYLEALACGVPVIASSADASREAVLDGALGAVVDPDDPASLLDALADALAAPPLPDRAALATFSVEAFHARWHALVACLTASKAPPVETRHGASPPAPHTHPTPGEGVRTADGKGYTAVLPAA